MRTLEELKTLAQSIYWNIENGELDEAARRLNEIQSEGPAIAACQEFIWRLDHNNVPTPDYFKKAEEMARQAIYNETKTTDPRPR